MVDSTADSATGSEEGSTVTTAPEEMPVEMVELVKAGAEEVGTARAEVTGTEEDPTGAEEESTGAEDSAASVEAGAEDSATEEVSSGISSTGALALTSPSVATMDSQVPEWSE